MAEESRTELLVVAAKGVVILLLLIVFSILVGLDLAPFWLGNP